MEFGNKERKKRKKQKKERKKETKERKRETKETKTERKKKELLEIPMLFFFIDAHGLKIQGRGYLIFLPKSLGFQEKLPGGPLLRVILRFY